MAQEDKVFDVASPGSSKPDTGSKPMVVGHKHMLDPTLTGPIESESASTEPMAARTEKTLSPTAKDTNNTEVNEVPETSSSTTSVKKREIKLEPIAETAAEPIPEKVQEPEPLQETIEAPVETAEEKQKNEDDLEVAREDKLQEMIKSKEYYAPINEASLTSFGSFVKIFTLVVLIGTITLIILIDTEIVDAGISLPFDLL